MVTKFYFVAFIIGFIATLHECPAQEASSNKGPLDQEKRESALKKELEDIIRGPMEEERHEKLRDLSIKLAAANPEGAWQWSKKILYVPDRIAFAIPLMRHWGRLNPLKALEASRELPDGELRLMIANAALEGWAKRDPLEALQWAGDHLSASYRRTAYAQIGEVWVRATASAKAADWGMKLSNEIERIFYVAEVLENWAEILPLDAAKWVSKLPPGKFHDLMISKVVSVWVQHYPKMAVEWIIVAPEYHWLLPNAVGKWARFDRLAAAAWLSLMADEHLSELCHAAIVTEWAQYNPAAAYQWSEANLKGEQLINARRAILGNWTVDYPLEALKWSQDLQPQEKRMSALEIIFETWSLADLTTCKAWVDKNDPGIEKDIGLGQLAYVLMESDPEAAASLGISIGDSGVQKTTLTRIIENWKTREPEKVKAWLQNNPSVLKLVAP